MMRTILTLPDGTVISSGHGSGRAIQSCVYTQCVNSGQELTLGSVCAAMVELKIWAPGGLEIAPGDRLLVYKTTDDAHHLLGVFFAETLERSSPNVLRLTAYDSVTRLDTDVSDWLQTVSFPCTLQALAKGVCGACGVSLGGDKLPNGSYLVEKNSSPGE